MWGRYNLTRYHPILRPLFSGCKTHHIQGSGGDGCHPYIHQKLRDFLSRRIQGFLLGSTPHPGCNRHHQDYDIIYICRCCRCCRWMCMVIIKCAEITLPETKPASLRPEKSMVGGWTFLLGLGLFSRLVLVSGRVYTFGAHLRLKGFSCHLDNRKPKSFTKTQKTTGGLGIVLEAWLPLDGLDFNPVRLKERAET